MEGFRQGVRRMEGLRQKACQLGRLSESLACPSHPLGAECDLEADRDTGAVILCKTEIFDRLPDGLRFATQQSASLTCRSFLARGKDAWRNFRAVDDQRLQGIGRRLARSSPYRCARFYAICDVVGMNLETGQRDGKVRVSDGQRCSTPNTAVISIRYFPRLGRYRGRIHPAPTKQPYSGQLAGSRLL